MVRFKVPLKDVLGTAYYHCELTSSDYNPTINSTITITCTCKNVLGNPIADKELTLMMNGTSQGTATTNANGIATWSITCSDWGNQHFNVENATLDLLITGWKQVQNSTLDGGATFKIFSNGELKRIEAMGNVNVQGQGSFTNVAVVDNQYKPSESTSPYPVNWTDREKWVKLTNNGYLQIFNTSTSGTAILEVCFIYY